MHLENSNNIMESYPINFGAIQEAETQLEFIDDLEPADRKTNKDPDTPATT